MVTVMHGIGDGDVMVRDVVANCNVGRLCDLEKCAIKTLTSLYPCLLPLVSSGVDSSHHSQ